jgi:hypothetical protein
MSVFEALDVDPADWPEPFTVTCTIPVQVISRLTCAWLDDDFLSWSRRQKDAEIIVEYDV